MVQLFFQNIHQTIPTYPCIYLVDDKESVRVEAIPVEKPKIEESLFNRLQAIKHDPLSLRAFKITYKDKLPEEIPDTYEEYIKERTEPVESPEELLHEKGVYIITKEELKQTRLEIYDRGFPAEKNIYIIDLRS